MIMELATIRVPPNFMLWVGPAICHKICKVLSPNMQNKGISEM